MLVASPVLYAGGIDSASPLVTVDLSGITLRVETFADRLVSFLVVYVFCISRRFVVEQILFRVYRKRESRRPLRGWGHSGILCIL